MKRVRIFTGLNYQEIEDDLNEFIKYKELVDIKMSTNYFGEHSFSPTDLTIIVIYKESAE